MKSQLVPFILFLVLAGCASHTHTNTATQTYSLEQISHFHLADQCSIYNMQGKWVRRYPGTYCYFESDGHLLMTDTKVLEFYNKDMVKLWDLKGHFHHQINKTHDGDYLLMSSTVEKYRTSKTRFDKFIKVDRNGKVISTFSFYDHLKELTKGLSASDLDILAPFTWDQSNKSLADYEFSHANSFYEIPPNSSTESELAAGNFIINSVGFNRIIILDKELKNILRIIIPTSTLRHDVQVTADGDILIYSNAIEEKNIKAAIRIRTYPDMLEKWVYRRNVASLNSAICGGAQILNKDLMLFTEINSKKSKAIILDSASKTEIAEVELQDTLGSQQIKVQDLTRFLQFNRGI
jgi:hypothetical protein